MLEELYEQRKRSLTVVLTLGLGGLFFSNVNPTKSNPDTSSGGCYIATACYGSYNCTQVLTFRNFRDEYLSQTVAGRIFINTYYALSPAVAEWLINKQKINNFIRKMLLEPIYDFLKKKY